MVMSETELENFILKYLSKGKFSKTQKLFTQAISSEKRRKTPSENFILEERFEKLQKHFFNAKKKENSYSINAVQSKVRWFMVSKDFSAIYL